MTQETDGSLIAIAKRIATAARDTRAWIRDAQATTEPIADEADSLILDARRVEGIARRLGAAAARRMGTGVFGASQQGKSYLISVLARPPGDASLRAQFGTQSHDFLMEINPQGGQESTGLVTRFTTAPTLGAADPACPVDVVLLSESDLVKILGNAFQSDFDQNNVQIPVPRGDEIKAILATARAAARPAAMTSHLDEIALYEIGDYFAANFSRRWQELERVRYWDEIITLAPQLTRDQRAALFSPIWGGLEELTGMFRVLVQALERLGFAGEAVASMAALLPRETSIIDVHTLLKLGLTTGNGTGVPIAVRARTADGTLAPALDLDRAVVAALAAELCIHVATCPWPMFEHADLIDFPGAKAREKFVALDLDPGKRFDQVNQLLRRGKVAYLFQRYTNACELTSLLLCHGNKPVDVNDLGPLIRQWLDVSHGSTPTARRQVPTSLFLVLTMMDLEFMAKGGETDESIKEKWDIRLHTSLYDKYQRDEWPKNFNGRPFDNIFLSRNPAFDQVHLVEYALRPNSDEPQRPLREVRLRSDRDYFGKARQAFFASSLVTTHISDPQRAWDAMCALNDGGTSYLIERLAEVSEPSLKHSQLESRLTECGKALYDRLVRFHHGLDPSSRREKEEALMALREHLVDAFAEDNFRRFIRFLGLLMLDPADIREIALSAPLIPPTPPAPSTDRPTAAKGRANIFGGRATPAAAALSLRNEDRALRFARTLCQRWIARLRQLARDDSFLAAFGLDGTKAGDIFDQLIIAADRLALAERIAVQVREATNLAAIRWEDIADRIVVIADNTLGAFLFFLGYQDIPIENRPGFPEEAETFERRIFEPPQRLVSGALPDLDDMLLPIPETRFIDWGIAFLNLGRDNLDHGGGRLLTPDLNRRLGGLLAALGARSSI